MSKPLELSNQNSANLASGNMDQLEIQALSEIKVPFASALRDDSISDSIIDEIPVAGGEVFEEFANEDFRLDSLVGDLSIEFKRRSSILGEHYPFEIDRGAITYTGSKSLVYELCLAISSASTITSGEFCSLPREFERMTVSLTSCWLGEDAQGYRAGWPPEGDRPSNFKDTIEELHDRSGEWWWQERNESYANPTEVKDGGVDVVAWRHPPDGRIGGVFLLGQCACGNNWNSKLSDLSPKLIQDKYVRDISVAEELRFFSTPFHIPHSKTWLDTSLAAGLLFDRVRLTIIAGHSSCSQRIEDDRKNSYEDLIRLVCPDFKT